MVPVLSHMTRFAWNDSQGVGLKKDIWWRASSFFQVHSKDFVTCFQHFLRDSPTRFFALTFLNETHHPRPWLKPWCKFAYGDIQIRPFFRVVANNANNFSAVYATTQKYTHELKIEQFSLLLPTTWKNDWRCRQQHGTFFCIVGHNTEKCSALWAATQKNCHNAKQFNIFCEPLSTLKGTVSLQFKDTFYH